MHSNELKIFFSKLADKFQRENDLSDVTWALCESSPGFKRLFLSYFFKELTDAVDVALDREFASGESRVDFHFLFNNRCHIIEFKKSDQDHHFDQYKAAFPGSRFGWIANYEIDGPVDVEIRTWRGFRAFLIDKLSSDIDTGTKNSIDGYCEYIRKVCSLIDMKKMNLSHASSLFFFSELVRKITRKSVGDLTCSPYAQSRGTKEGLVGMHFALSRTEQVENPIFPWFGLYYDDAKAGIAVVFSQSWCRIVYDRFTVDMPTYDHLYTFEEDGCYWFEMKETHFEKFNSESIQKQEELLNGFFISVIEIVGSRLSVGAITSPID